MALTDEIQGIELDTSSLPFPIGASAEWNGANDPPGGVWMIEDGRSLLRTDYPELFAVVSTTFGAVDGTHFNIPDSRGRVAVGVDGAAGRLSANDALGNVSGEEKHTLTPTETAIRSHSHFYAMGSGASAADLSDIPARHAGGSDNNSFATGAGAPTSGEVNASASHNNMQPYIVKNKIIRVK